MTFGHPEMTNIGMRCPLAGCPRMAEAGRVEVGVGYLTAGWGAWLF